LASQLLSALGTLGRGWATLRGFPDCTLPRTLAASSAPEVGLTAPIPERRQVACSHQQFSAQLKLATEERHCKFMKRTLFCLAHNCNHTDQTMASSLKSLWARLFRSKTSPTLECAICHKPVPVEASKTDSDGRAVHEDCYFQQIKLKRIRNGYA